MGNGIKFAGANRAYGPPEGVSEEQCKTLHVFTNGACIVSCWEFSDAELAEILRTKRAFLSVWSGSVLFPVFVGSESVTRGLVADSGAVWKQEQPAPAAATIDTPIEDLDVNAMAGLLEKSLRDKGLALSLTDGAGVGGRTQEIHNLCELASALIVNFGGAD